MMDKHDKNLEIMYFPPFDLQGPGDQRGAVHDLQIFGHVLPLELFQDPRNSQVSLGILTNSEEFLTIPDMFSEICPVVFQLPGLLLN